MGVTFLFLERGGGVAAMRIIVVLGCRLGSPYVGKLFETPKPYDNTTNNNDNNNKVILIKVLEEK